MAAELSSYFCLLAARFSSTSSFSRLLRFNICVVAVAYRGLLLFGIGLLLFGIGLLFFGIGLLLFGIGLLLFGIGLVSCRVQRPSSFRDRPCSCRVQRPSSFRDRPCSCRVQRPSSFRDRPCSALGLYIALFSCDKISSCF